MTVTSINKMKDGEVGQLPYTENNYFIFVPSTGFASDEALNSTSYPNRDISRNNPSANPCKY